MLLGMAKKNKRKGRKRAKKGLKRPGFDKMAPRKEKRGGCFSRKEGGGKKKVGKQTLFFCFLFPRKGNKGPPIPKFFFFLERKGGDWRLGGPGREGKRSGFFFGGQKGKEGAKKPPRDLFRKDKKHKRRGGKKKEKGPTATRPVDSRKTLKEKKKVTDQPSSSGEEKKGKKQATTGKKGTPSATECYPKKNGYSLR